LWSCSPGFTGEVCDQCSEGLFGDNCDKTCEKCVENHGVCNQTTGNCDCYNSFSGVLCQDLQISGFDRSIYEGNVVLGNRVVSLERETIVNGDVTLITSVVTVGNQLSISGTFSISEKSKLTFSTVDYPITCNCTHIGENSTISTSLSKERKNEISKSQNGAALIQTTCLQGAENLKNHSECVDGYREGYNYDQQSLNVVFSSCVKPGYIALIAGGAVLGTALFGVSAVFVTPLKKIVTPFRRH